LLEEITMTAIKPEITDFKPFMVDLTLTPEELIKQSKFDEVYERILLGGQKITRCPEEKRCKTKVSAKSVWFDRDGMTTEDILKEFQKLDLRHAYNEELIMFGNRFPKSYRTFPIAAIGFPWWTKDWILWPGASSKETYTLRVVPVLHTRDSNGRDWRQLWAGHYDDMVWNKDIRFLGVADQ
jgi:hypothetical protein